MKVDFLAFLSFMILTYLIEVTCSSSKEKTKKKEKSKKALTSRRRSMERYEEEEEEPQQQYVTEEYERKVMQVRRLGDYLVGYIDVSARNKSSEKERVEYLDPRAATYDKRKERKKNKKKFDVVNTHFNNDVDSISEASSVPDEYPRVRPTVMEDNALYSDFIAGKGTLLIHHISNGIGDFDIPYVEDDSDVLARVIKGANFYTYHHYEYDGFMTASKKEERIHLWRNEKIHPKRTYVRENEVDPTVPHYDKYDVETSQKDMETHFGRGIGRDNKPKLFANRNTFSSINSGCAIM